MKWGAPVLGTGAAVTYALVTAPSAFPDARNCRSLVPVAGLLERNDIAASVFRAEVALAFEAWSVTANIAFRPADPATANILIGAEADPFGHAFTNVTPAADEGGTAPIARAVICLNPEERWKVGFGGRLDVFDLRYTLEHEIGHAIGLDHPGVAGVLMDFRYREKFTGPQAGDIAGAVALYGPRDETAPVVVVGQPAPQVPPVGTAEVGFSAPAN